MESLEEKLRSLGVFTGASNIISAKRINTNPIETVIEGEYSFSPFGITFIANQLIPFGSLHGNFELTKNVNPDILTGFLGINLNAPVSLEEIIFLDTETTGLSGGAGTLVFLAGLGYYSPAGFHLSQIFLDKPGEEKAFLSALECILSPFKLMITYNGKSFDIPLLNNRGIINNFSSPFSSLHHIDLLHLTRKVWKLSYTDRSLGTLEQQVLQFQRSGEDIPGWLVPSRYIDYLHDGDARPLAGVFYHNGIDILSLAALYSHLSDILIDPYETDEDYFELISIAYIHECKKETEKAISLYKKAINICMPDNSSIWPLFRLANLYKLVGDWQNAIQYWEKAALHDDYKSCIELAKYYEHKSKDISTAIFWTQKAILLSGSRKQINSINNCSTLSRRNDRLREKKGREK